ncbi:glucose-6-phosphate isomerase [Orrella marina]|uniref:Glucose-6-phosphate isomerase n=1 Tax=Orrella marina TaxID=2163011 RepID=A0A2R4XKP2_9BURK|nr:glucose-6-phosphate isomerase [Orrella marina]AWB34351.1 glucose-6-phosphate isomerase [Orrella marina]
MNKLRLSDSSSLQNSETVNKVWSDFERSVRSAHQKRCADTRIIRAADLDIDLSLQHNSQEMNDASVALLEAHHFNTMRQALFRGEHVNWTEDRPALHTALRQSPAPEVVSAQIAESLACMKAFVDQCNARNQFRNIVHLGIGGSDWGPRMVWESLRGHETRRKLRFAANIDAQAITTALDGLDPRDTLLVIASKSFTTIESITNAKYALQWMRNAGVEDPYAQTVALTANRKAAQAFGVPDAQIFEFWDWVGGRYSLWSSIGMSLALTLGWSTFLQLLAGARDMDTHFMDSPVQTNAPVQMALSAVANTSVLGYSSQVICPYDARLAGFVMWLQQLEMESLGKSVDENSRPIRLHISPAVWGMPGTDSQHTFFQWLHQDQTGAPVDFIVRRSADCQHPEHQRLLVANCLAQRATLWQGKPLEQVRQELAQAGRSEDDIEKLAPHLVHPGNRPSTLIVLPELSAHTLGSLLALYEHKVFVQSVLWGINPFDQWGVEFGKNMARRMTQGDQQALGDLDASTRYWMQSLLSDG